MIGIYMIINQINNKVYIGQSQNIKQRWRAHRTRPFNSNSNDYEKPLYRSIRKYGLNNFIFQVLEECRIEELDEREIYWITFYDATNPEKGYNLTKGGSYTTPIKLTWEEVDKIIYYLQETNEPQEQIAKRFNISQRTVSGINLGEYWVKNDIAYPIRKKQENKCLICGKKICQSSKYCFTCSGLIQRKTKRPNRQQLKELIRTKSFIQIGKDYGVSDNAIRRWCEAEGLPSKKTIIKQYTDEEWALI